MGACQKILLRFSSQKPVGKLPASIHEKTIPIGHKIGEGTEVWQTDHVTSANPLCSGDFVPDLAVNGKAAISSYAPTVGLTCPVLT
jgi:hypothetical protein